MAQQSAPRPIVSFNVQALVVRILIWEAGADKNANGQPPQGTSEMNYEDRPFSIHVEKQGTDVIMNECLQSGVHCVRLISTSSRLIVCA